MKVWLLFIGLSPLAAVMCGCQSGPNCDSLILENFQLQERILALEIQAEERQRMLCGALKQLEEDQEKKNNDKSNASNGASEQQAKQPDVEMGTPTPAGEPEPPPKYDPKSDEGSPPRDEPKFPPSPNEAAPEVEGLPTSGVREPQDGEARKLTIDPDLTVGLNENDGPGDEGLVVVLEPRNAHGQLLAVAGDVEIAVWDAELLSQFPDDPRRAHIAVWQVPGEEVAKNLRQTRDGPKVRLQLRWAKNRPRHEKLRIFARFRTPEGQTLETRAPVRIALRSASANRGLATHAAPPSHPVRQARADLPIKKPVKKPMAFQPIEQKPLKQPERREIPSWTPDR